MHDSYVHWHCSIDCCVKLSLVDETLCKKWLSFYKETISAKFLLGNVFLGGKLQIDAKNSNFKIFESALLIKSGSLPLNVKITWQLWKQGDDNLFIVCSLFRAIHCDIFRKCDIH